MQRLIIFLVGMTLVLAVPTQFDMRVQASIVKYANYGLTTEGICSGYAWAKELAQVVSNAVSLYEKQRYSLSAQHLLDCTETFDDKCYKSTKENILKAMDQIAKKGLTTNDCYLNTPLEQPSAFCKQTCADGFPFDFIFKASFQKHDSALDVFNLYKRNDNVVALAIIKVDESFNYYNSFKGELSGSAGEVYEYRVAEIVGWKNSQKKIIVRAGPGAFWGFNGYIELDLQKYGHYIDSYYSCNIQTTQNLKTQMM